jgi:hypothetical protein
MKDTRTLEDSRREYWRRSERHGNVPHLWLFKGYWRVSHWNRRQDSLKLWSKANEFAGVLTNKLREKS